MSYPQRSAAPSKGGDRCADLRDVGSTLGDEVGLALGAPHRPITHREAIPSRDSGHACHLERLSANVKERGIGDTADRGVNVERPAVGHILQL